MGLDNSVEEWIGLATPLPWGIAFESETMTYKIVARTAAGEPRVGADGAPIVVAQGLSQPDAIILIGLRERFRGTGRGIRRDIHQFRVVE